MQYRDCSDYHGGKHETAQKRQGMVSNERGSIGEMIVIFGEYFGILYSGIRYVSCLYFQDRSIFLHTLYIHSPLPMMSRRGYHLTAAATTVHAVG